MGYRSSLGSLAASPAQHGARRSKTSIFRLSQRALLAFAVVLMGSVAAIGLGPDTANAVVIDSAIQDVRVQEETSPSGAQVKVLLDWAVPNGSAEGDTFDFQLPAELTKFTTTFDLHAVGDELVGTAEVSNSGLVTFTLSDYVATHPLDVHGTAYFWVTFVSSEPSGTDIPLVFTSGNEEYFDSIVVTGSQTIDRTKATKGGTWVDADDQGRFRPANALTWSLATPKGPLNNVVIQDTLGAGQSFDCSQQFYLQTAQVIDAKGTFGPYTGLSSADYSLDCDDQIVTITMKRPLAFDEVVVVWLNSSVTDPSRSNYENSVTVTADSGSYNGGHTVRRYDAGGEGTGTAIGELAINKVVSGEGAPTGPFTIQVDCQWAGAAAPGFPQSLTFNGAESQRLSAPIGSVCSAIETVTGGADKVEISPDVTIASADSDAFQITVTNTFEAAPPGPDPVPVPDPTPDPSPSPAPSPTPDPKPAPAPHSPKSTDQPVKKAGSPVLAETGTATSAWLVTGALTLLLGSAAVLLARRRAHLSGS